MHDVEHKNTDVPSEQGSQQLHRVLKLREAVALGVGGTIGGGIFVLVGAAAGRAGPGALRAGAEPGDRSSDGRAAWLQRVGFAACSYGTVYTVSAIWSGWCGCGKPAGLPGLWGFRYGGGSGRGDHFSRAQPAQGNPVDVAHGPWSLPAGHVCSARSASLERTGHVTRSPRGSGNPVSRFHWPSTHGSSGAADDSSNGECSACCDVAGCLCHGT